MAEPSTTSTLAVSPASSLSQRLAGIAWGLGTALCFAVSPVFIRLGLEGLQSPLLGVTVGMVFSTAVYGLLLLVRRNGEAGAPIARRTLVFQVIAGLLVGLSTWARWFALDLAPVGVVLGLGRLNVPVVILISPWLIGGQLEKVTWKIWLGAGFILAGSVILALHG